MQNGLADYAEVGEALEVPDGTCLFRPGDEGSAFLIVQSGAVRVEQTNASGRTVVLYRVTGGQSCMLTTTCLMSGLAYSGYGYAEGPVRAAAIHAERFRSLLRDDDRFRALVFEGVAGRVQSLTDVIDDLLEHRTDLRLARWLARHGIADHRMTQQDLAEELGTAREVVSRALKSFEQRGWIVVGRGSITVRDPAALKSHGASDEV